MAKFCGNCGMQLDDGARICGQCGTPLEGISSTGPGMKVVDPQKQKEQQKKLNKTIGLCAGVFALVLVAVIAFKIISAFTGYNGLIRKTMNAYEDYDIDTLISLSSEMYFFGSDSFAENYFEEAVGSDLDDFESSVGHSYKLSYEVDEVYPLSTRAFNSIMDNISWLFSDFDSSTIEEIVVAEITVTAKQGSRSIKKELEITMSKEDGDWRLLYIE